MAKKVEKSSSELDTYHANRLRAAEARRAFLVAKERLAKAKADHNLTRARLDTALGDLVDGQPSLPGVMPEEPEPKKGTEEPPAGAALPENWEDVEIVALLSYGMTEAQIGKLTAAGLSTFGALSELESIDEVSKKIKGFGPRVVERLGAAMDDFVADHPNIGKQIQAAKNG